MSYINDYNNQIKNIYNELNTDINAKRDTFKTQINATGSRSAIVDNNELTFNTYSTDLMGPLKNGAMTDSFNSLGQSTNDDEMVLHVDPVKYPSGFTKVNRLGAETTEATTEEADINTSVDNTGTNNDRWVNRTLYKFNTHNWGISYLNYHIPIDALGGLPYEGSDFVIEEAVFTRVGYPNDVIRFVNTCLDTVVPMSVHNKNCSLLWTFSRFKLPDPALGEYTQLYYDNCSFYDTENKMLYLGLPDKSFGFDLLNTTWEVKVVMVKNTYTFSASNISASIIYKEADKSDSETPTINLLNGKLNMLFNYHLISNKHYSYYIAGDCRPLDGGFGDEGYGGTPININNKFAFADIEVGSIFNSASEEYVTDINYTNFPSLIYYGDNFTLFIKNDKVKYVNEKYSTDFDLNETPTLSEVNGETNDTLIDNVENVIYISKDSMIYKYELSQELKYLGSIRSNLANSDAKSVSNGYFVNCNADSIIYYTEFSDNSSEMLNVLDYTRSTGNNLNIFGKIGYYYISDGVVSSTSTYPYVTCNNISGSATIEFVGDSEVSSINIAEVYPVSAQVKYTTNNEALNLRSDCRIVYLDESISENTLSTDSYYDELDEMIADECHESIMPASKSWQSVCYGNDKFVAVSYNSNVSAYSTDGITWIQSEMPSDEDWYSVCYGNDKFVAVATGNVNIAAYSTDGITWIQSALPASKSWQSVCYGNDKFVAVSYNSNVSAYSTDGITWIQSEMPASKYWYSVCYGNGKFVAVSYSISNISAYSTDGITWTQSELPASQYWQSVCYGNGKFVAVARYSFVAAYSTDGITWIQSVLPASESWESVCYGNGKFVAVAPNSNVAAYIYPSLVPTNSSIFTDVEFTTNTLKANTNIIGIANYMHGTTLIVNNNNAVYTSADGGANWNPIALVVSEYGYQSAVSSESEVFIIGNDIKESIVYDTADKKISEFALLPIDLDTQYPWEDICYGNGAYVAIAKSYRKVYYSMDAISWTEAETPYIGFWSSICYGEDKFVIIQGGGAPALYSLDGINWNAMSLASSDYYWTSICYGNGMFVAVSAGGSSGSNGSMYSTDGINWTESTLPLGEWSSVCYGNGKFVAVASSFPSSMYSTDGIIWIPGDLDSEFWQSICYGNGVFVAVNGNNLKTAYSTDGINWTYDVSGKIAGNHVVYGDGKFVSINHADFSYQYCSDGLNWITVDDTQGAPYWNSMCYGNGIYILGAAKDNRSACLVQI